MSGACRGGGGGGGGRTHAAPAAPTVPAPRHQCRRLHPGIQPTPPRRPITFRTTTLCTWHMPSLRLPASAPLHPAVSCHTPCSALRPHAQRRPARLRQDHVGRPPRGRAPAQALLRAGLTAGAGADEGGAGRVEAARAGVEGWRCSGVVMQCGEAGWRLRMITHGGGQAPRTVPCREATDELRAPAACLKPLPLPRPLSLPLPLSLSPSQLLCPRTHKFHYPGSPEEVRVCACLLCCVCTRVWEKFPLNACTLTAPLLHTTHHIHHTHTHTHTHVRLMRSHRSRTSYAAPVCVFNACLQVFALVADTVNVMLMRAPQVARNYIIDRTQ